MANDEKDEKKRGEDLSKRGMKDGKYRSGSFKKAKKRGFKVSNLNKKQVKRGTYGKGKNVSKKQAEAAQSNTVDISKTKFTKGEGVTVDGKLFTGNVKLASGKTAYYVNGRRVMSGGPKPKGGSSSRGGSSSGGGGGGGGGYRAPMAKDTSGKTTYNPGGGTTTTKDKAISIAEKRLAARKEAMKKGGGKDSNPSYIQGEPANRVNSGKKRIGDTRSVPYGNRTRKERWDGSKWVPVNRFGK